MKALHKAGIEVLLDLVYNHTVEGDPQRSLSSVSLHAYIRTPVCLACPKHAAAATGPHSHMQDQSLDLLEDRISLQLKGALLRDTHQQQRRYAVVQRH